jgi:hypothetical protein
MRRIGRPPEFSPWQNSARCYPYWTAVVSAASQLEADKERSLRPTFGQVDVAEESRNQRQPTGKRRQTLRSNLGRKYIGW